MDTGSFFHRVDSDDIGVVESREGLRLVREPDAALFTFGELCRKNLQGDLAAELRVLRQIHVAHPTRADLLQDLVVGELRPTMRVEKF